MLGRKFITFNAFIRNEEFRSQISDLNFHLMKQENEEVIKPKANTRKRIIKRENQ